MSNPFDYIRKAQDERARELEREKRRTAESKKRRDEWKKKYIKMVKPVLEQLAKVAFRGYKISEDGWSIGIAREEEHLWIWDMIVEVSLVFDANDSPTHFSIRHDLDEIKTGLTREELVAGIKQMFPPGKV